MLLLLLLLLFVDSGILEVEIVDGDGGVGKREG